MSWKLCEDWLKRIIGSVGDQIEFLKDDLEEAEPKDREMVKKHIADMQILQDVLVEKGSELVNQCAEYHQQKLM